MATEIAGLFENREMRAVCVDDQGKLLVSRIATLPSPLLNGASTPEVSASIVSPQAASVMLWIDGYGDDLAAEVVLFGSNDPRSVNDPSAAARIEIGRFILSASGKGPGVLVAVTAHPLTMHNGGQWMAFAFIWCELVSITGVQPRVFVFVGG